MLEVISNLNQMPALKADWERLSQTIAFPMLSYEWASAAAAALNRNDRLCLVVLRTPTDNRVSAIAPLVRLGSSARCLTSLVNHCLPEPSGFLFEGTTALHQLLKGVMRLGYPLCVKRLPIEIASLVQRSAAPMVFLRSELGAPRLTIRETWEDFERAMSAQRRSDIRRAMRRAEALGKVELNVASPAPEAVGRFLAQFDQIESRSWKFEAGTAVQQHPALHRFMQHLCSAFAEKSGLRTALLCIDEMPVAAQIALSYRSAYWVLKIAHAEQFSTCSPGLILTHELVRAAFAEQVQAFEFLGVEEPWIHTWTRDTREFQKFLAYGYSLKSATALASQLGRSVRMRLGRRKENAHV